MDQLNETVRGESFFGTSSNEPRMHNELGGTIPVDTLSPRSKRAPSIVIVSTYPPTQCGLATFAAATRDSILRARSTWSLSIVKSCPSKDSNNPGDPGDQFATDQRHANEVSACWYSGSAQSFAQAKDALDLADCILVQHEFGIFGGPDGREIVDLLDATVRPAIAVLHTVLATPSPGQRSVISALGRRCSALVVMSESARRRLLDLSLVPAHKVRVIPHGAHPVRYQRPMATGRVPQLLTWGLVGPGKGLERAIDAVAALRSRGIEVRYQILGETHPKVRLREGEHYRESLRKRADNLGVSDCVVFDDAYRTVPELMAMVVEADVVVIPYDTREQVTSGVLVEALAAGKPVVATAFPHAVECLQSGGGIVVEHDDPAAMVDALAAIVTNPSRARRMSEVAKQEGASMLWPAVGESFAALIEQVLHKEKLSHPRRGQQVLASRHIDLHATSPNWTFPNSTSPKRTLPKSGQPIVAQGLVETLLSDQRPREQLTAMQGKGLKQRRFVDQHRADVSIGGAVGEIDRVGIDSVDSLNEHHVVDVTVAFPFQRWFHYRVRKHRENPTRVNVEDSDFQGVMAVGSAFVKEQPQSGAAGQRRRPRSNAEAPGTGTDHDVGGKVLYMHVPVTSVVGVPKVLEVIEDRNLHIGMKPVHKRESTVGEIENDGVFVGQLRMSERGSGFVVNNEPAVFFDNPVRAYLPRSLFDRVVQRGVRHDDVINTSALYSLYAGIFDRIKAALIAAKHDVIEFVIQAVVRGEQQYVTDVVQKPWPLQLVASIPIADTPSKKVIPAVVMEQAGIKYRRISGGISGTEERSIADARRNIRIRGRNRKHGYQVSSFRLRNSRMVNRQQQ